MVSIILGKGNEEALTKRAQQLGYEYIYFLDSFNAHGIVECTKKNCISLKKKNLVIFKQPDQSVFEKTKPDLVIHLENNSKLDRTHQRLSGFNQVLAKLAKKNNIALLYDLNQIYDPIQLGRIQQNIMLCNKYHVQVCITSLVSKPEQIPHPKDLILAAKKIGLKNYNSILNYKLRIP